MISGHVLSFDQRWWTIFLWVRKARDVGRNVTRIIRRESQKSQVGWDFHVTDHEGLGLPCLSNPAHCAPCFEVSLYTTLTEHQPH